MITMYTARTSEIDEINEAISEIKSQIDFSSLKKNSGGLIFCHIDFVSSGVVAALCKELPFHIIGMTSMATADEHGYSLFELNLTVLTSDEVVFEAGMTNGIDENNYNDEVHQLYNKIRSRVTSDPSMIFTFMPYIREVSGYEVVASMDAACHGIPMWGSITNNIDFNYETVQTICNGNNLSSGVAMMFLNGPIEPKFIVSSIPECNIANKRAIITKSNGAVLHEINDLPVLKYLANVGLTINKENITTTPMMVYYDGADIPVALGFYTMFEDGSLLTGGKMPIGTSVAVGSIDAQGITESSENGLKQILDCKNRQATLLLPCVTRYIMLAPDQEKELRLIKEKLAASGKPFMMGYSGGEICPMPGPDGKFRNRFHNYTFCACLL
ncbi:MAG: FIST C-terminal domain-containing protein [Desulfobulbus sp.]|uniref:FIST N-terminal domain-containing protein n=1 Tax=Desulfobulbus sp. TaxID=895 RepID=UPI00283DE104|nr:FIST N-terminal domain-containing protein [Desulfobulbus sp.]MDR2550410.1 FIST C-terminal domain-containing protein [Desulfobulbus sp.]